MKTILLALALVFSSLNVSAGSRAIHSYSVEEINKQLGSKYKLQVMGYDSYVNYIQADENLKCLNSQVNELNKLFKSGALTKEESQFISKTTFNFKHSGGFDLEDAVNASAMMRGDELIISLGYLDGRQCLYVKSNELKDVIKKAAKIPADFSKSVNTLVTLTKEATTSIPAQRAVASEDSQRSRTKPKAFVSQVQIEIKNAGK